MICVAISVLKSQIFFFFFHDSMTKQCQPKKKKKEAQEGIYHISATIVNIFTHAHAQISTCMNLAIIQENSILQMKTRYEEIQWFS